MTAAMVTWPACIAAWAGFLALALAMDRHHDQILGGRPRPGRRRVFTLAGWCLLICAGAGAVLGWGWSIGLAALWGVLSLAGGALVLALSHAPRHIPRITMALIATIWLPLLFL
ncbi:DUF3325 domain-containing protein [Tistrella sp. BH-R2-4]|jgi:hypothetical protein|uniref:DUF3325 domain-containing protein n=1 Tax=Tistrella arctica TaxID=3133430 RepID=A0ABU9YRU2_9PROT